MSVPVESDLTQLRRDAALRYLLDRINYERMPVVPYRAREFKLQRMHELLDRIGRPQDEFPIIHIAGTKGKGSTAAMLSAVLSSAGLRTGLFTSPHLERIEQRIMIDGQACSAEVFAELVESIQPIVEAMDARAAADPHDSGPTYFEITTAMAIRHFARRAVDVGILEVGLGGRLDSTNVCRPEVSVITNISFDHMKQLGNTLAEIAREKAGIIKPGVPVVSGVTQREPRRVIREICQERGCRLVELGRDFQVDYAPPRDLHRQATCGTLDFRYPTDAAIPNLDRVRLGLLGRHQANNAAVALAVLAELRGLGWNISEQAIRSGLEGVQWPARVEVVARHPVVIVDSAHNAASIEALTGVLRESFAPRKRVLIFATTQEKDIRAMLEQLDGQFDEILLTRYINNPRGVPPEELRTLAEQTIQTPCRVCSNPTQAWATASELAEADDLICITGSFFIAAEMRELVKGCGVGSDVLEV